MDEKRDKERKKEELSEIICELIAYAGDSKSLSIEAMEKARSGDFEEADRLLEKSQESLSLSHKIHSSLITSEARGEKVETNMLLMHAADIFSTAEVSHTFAEQFIELCKEVV